MKVFVPIIGEGYDSPLGVYSTEEKAQAALDRADREGDYYEIKYYELDGDINENNKPA